MPKRHKAILVLAISLLGLISVIGKVALSEPKPSTPLYQVIVARGYQIEGFRLGDNAENMPSMTETDHTIWNVPHRIGNGRLSGWPARTGKYCYYNFYRTSKSTGLFGEQHWYWYFQLRKDESWGDDSSYKPGINWSKPPAISEPTPEQLWQFLNKWVNNPMSECNPVVR